MAVVYSYYVLDIVHRGHLLQMQNAKKMVGKDGKSIVGILTKEAVLEKKPRKPVLNFDERMNLAQSIRCVDVVVPQKTYSPIGNLKMLQPDIHLESDSHTDEDIKKVKDYMKSINGRVFIMPYYPYQSSTGIKNKIKNGDIDSTPKDGERTWMKGFMKDTPEV
jgi:glycerol-3-phosphate cytidylyltransferase-like family protein